MEQLLSVEIIRDKCRCCLKQFLSRHDNKIQVTTKLQDIFLDFLNEELENGHICNKCNEYLMMFQTFKVEISLCRQDRQDKLDFTIYLKDEPAKELLIKKERAFDERIESVKENSTIYYPTESEATKGSAVTEPFYKAQKYMETNQEHKKETKLKKLLDKYNVQFLNDDVGHFKKSEKIICPICLKVLSVLSFSTHLKIHKGGREYNFMCEICSTKCVSNAELIVHRRRHTKEKPFQCDHCVRRFFNCKKNLIAHFRNIHLNQRKTKQDAQQCTICLKKFAPEYLIHQHIKNAHPNGTDDGVKVNPETNHYHCETCGGQYRTRRYFDNHVCISGTNDGPTQSECLICFMNFSSRLETMKHIQEVHAEKVDRTRWRCLVCNKTLLDKIVLHIESVHTSKSSKCGLCNKELKNRRCLKNHIYVMHQNGSEVRKQKRRSNTLSRKN